MYYQRVIREILAQLGRIGVDPRHVEAWMRLEHSTLDGLSRGQFRAEVLAALDCIDADPHASERLALSYGL
jgi:hypothetical protein